MENTVANLSPQQAAVFEPVSAEGIRTLILYNPFSLDSLMAATILVDSGVYPDHVVREHHYLDVSVSVNGFDRVIAVGMELNKDVITAIVQSTEAKITIFKYRDGYEWLAAEKFFKKDDKHNRFTVLAPDEEYHGRLTQLTDNTLTKMAHHHVITFNEGYKKTPWKPWIDLVSRQASRALPLMGFEFDVDVEADPVEEMMNRMRLFDLAPKLRTALGSSNPGEKIRQIKVEPNQVAYKGHKTMLGYTLARSMNDDLIPKGDGKSYPVRMVQANELMAVDIVGMAAAIDNGLVTYEDVKAFRIWRVYSGKHRVAASILSCMKPIATWSEGLFMCGITERSSSTV